MYVIGLLFKAFSQMIYIFPDSE